MNYSERAKVYKEFCDATHLLPSFKRVTPDTRWETDSQVSQAEATRARDSFCMFPDSVGCEAAIQDYLEANFYRSMLPQLAKIPEIRRYLVGAASCKKKRELSSLLSVAIVEVLRKEGTLAYDSMIEKIINHPCARGVKKLYKCTELGVKSYNDLVLPERELSLPLIPGVETLQILSKGVLTRDLLPSQTYFHVPFLPVSPKPDPSCRAHIYAMIFRCERTWPDPRNSQLKTRIRPARGSFLTFYINQDWAQLHPIRNGEKGSFLLAKIFQTDYFKSVTISVSPGAPNYYIKFFLSWLNHGPPSQPALRANILPLQSILRPEAPPFLPSNSSVPPQSNSNSHSQSKEKKPPLLSIPPLTLSLLNLPIWSLDQVKTNCTSTFVPYSKFSFLCSFLVERINRFKSDDLIFATDYVVSLKCPISLITMSNPVRSTFCKHLQCFDGSYLERFPLNSHESPWKTCPICRIAYPQTSLYIDGYMREIITVLAGSTTDKVQISTKDWTWKPDTPSISSSLKRSKENLIVDLDFNNEKVTDSPKAPRLRDVPDPKPSLGSSVSSPILLD